MTWAPSSARSSRPRVRFAYRTSKPPDPSPSARACTLTTTSSPTSTSPVVRGYATHGEPSTSSRTRSPSRSVTAVTRPRLSESGIEQRERHVDHRLEIGDCDVLVRRVDLGHPVREVHALEAALVEDVRVGRATRERVRDVEAGATQPVGGERDGAVVAREAVPAVALPRRRLNLTLRDTGRERDGILHLLYERAERSLVVRPRLGDDGAPFGDDVRGRSARDRADVRGRDLVHATEPHLRDRTRGGGDRRPALVGEHSCVRGAAVEGELERQRRWCPEDDLADRRRLVVDVPDARLQPGMVERARAEQADLLLRREEQLDPRVRASLGEHAPRRLEHRDDRGLVVGAEDRRAGVANDTLVDDGVDIVRRGDRVEVGAEEEGLAVDDGFDSRIEVADRRADGC